jgi:hypothetical protein
MTADALARRLSHPRTCAAAGALLLLLAAAGVLLDRRAFFAAWLAAWWCWAGIVLGAQATLWLHRLTGGAWIDPIALPLDRLRAAMPVIVLAILPVLLWPAALYPWAHPGWVDEATVQGFRHAWFTPWGMALRVLACLLLCATMARLDGARATLERAAADGTATHRSGYAAAGLLVYALAISIVAVDLLMSLMPTWYSTAFGLVVLTAALQAALALATIAGARAATPQARGDLGNLLLMYVMTLTYLSFTQFQIIWAENLPAEISWYVPRSHGFWLAVCWIMVIGGFAIPLLALLSRALKRSERGLRGLSMLLLAVYVLQAAWWVMPSAPPIGIHAAWMTVCALAGMGLLVRAAGLWAPGRAGAWHA